MCAVAMAFTRALRDTHEQTLHFCNLEWQLDLNTLLPLKHGCLLQSHRFASCHRILNFLCQFQLHLVCDGCNKEADVGECKLPTQMKARIDSTTWERQIGQLLSWALQARHTQTCPQGRSSCVLVATMHTTHSLSCITASVM